MLERVTSPVKVALTGPTLAWTFAVIAVSEVFSSDWQPGIDSLRMIGSFSASQTVSRGAGIRYSPDISISSASLAGGLALVHGVLGVLVDGTALSRFLIFKTCCTAACGAARVGR